MTGPARQGPEIILLSDGNGLDLCVLTEQLCPLGPLTSLVSNTHMPCQSSLQVMHEHLEFDIADF